MQMQSAWSLAIEIIIRSRQMRIAAVATHLSRCRLQIRCCKATADAAAAADVAALVFNTVADNLRN